jgi:hypothetical protein
MRGVEWSEEDTAEDLVDKLRKCETSQMRCTKSCSDGCGCAYRPACLVCWTWLVNLLLCPVRGWFTVGRWTRVARPWMHPVVGRVPLFLTARPQVDLLSCLPISYIQLLTTPDHGDGSDNGLGADPKNDIRMVRILRLLRLAKLLRLARLGRWLEKYAEDLREFYAGDDATRLPAVWRYASECLRLLSSPQGSPSCARS